MLEAERIDGRPRRGEEKGRDKGEEEPGVREERREENGRDWIMLVVVVLLVLAEAVCTIDVAETLDTSERVVGYSEVDVDASGAVVAERASWKRGERRGIVKMVRFGMMVMIGRRSASNGCFDIRWDRLRLFSSQSLLGC